jgi:sensor histidine kinase YesM
MTNNQQLMSILSSAGENRQLKETTIILACIVGVAVVAAVVLIPKYTESIGENKRLKLNNREIRSALYFAKSELEISKSEREKISNYASQMEKENIQLKNDRIRQEKA